MDFLRPLFNDELNNEGDIMIAGSTFQRSRILVELEPETYELNFQEWLENRKQSMLEKAGEILALYDNANRFESLKQALKGGGA